MSKMLGIINYNPQHKDKEKILKSINLLSAFNVETFENRNILFAATGLKNCKTRNIFISKNQLIMLCGDIIGFDTADLIDVIDEIIKHKKFEQLNDISGRFAIAYLDRYENKLLIISDRRAQQPIYYSQDDDKFYFSSDLTTFCRMPLAPIFNKKWLYYYLFFNYSIDQTTFIENVYKMPPATILIYNLKNCKISLSPYSDKLKKSKSILSGKESYRYACEKLKVTIPNYFKNNIACSLTGGWDGRTILAFAKNFSNITTYTYGIAGCADLINAVKVAEIENLRHISIYFDKEFVKNLPLYILKAVYLSSGTENILRAARLYVYENLTNYGKRFPYVTTGIGFDGIFRGHSIIPQTLSYDVAEIFKSGKILINKKFWEKVYKNEYKKFENIIENGLLKIKNEYGQLNTPELHLLFKLYITHPELFGGEVKIAENYTNIRSPAWDPKIIDLAFSIKESGLTMSDLIHHNRGGLSEVKLQAYLLKTMRPLFSTIPIGPIRPDYLYKSIHLAYLYKIYKGIKKRIRKNYRIISPLEDWTDWLNVVHGEFINRLIFSKNSMVSEYLSEEFLKSVKENRNTHWIGKIATVEIILRLIENRWNFSSLTKKLNLKNTKAL